MDFDFQDYLSEFWMKTKLCAEISSHSLGISTKFDKLLLLDREHIFLFRKIRMRKKVFSWFYKVRIDEMRGLRHGTRRNFDFEHVFLNTWIFAGPLFISQDSLAQKLRFYIKLLTDHPKSGITSSLFQYIYRWKIVLPKSCLRYRRDDSTHAWSSNGRYWRWRWPRSARRGHRLRMEKSYRPLNRTRLLVTQSVHYRHISCWYWGKL